MLAKSISLRVVAGLSLIAALSWPAQANNALQSVIEDPRRESESVRDIYRHPYQTLTFFGIKPTDTVIELWPGGGAWYSSVLAPYLKSDGQYVAANFRTKNIADGEPGSGFFLKAGKKFLTKTTKNKDWWGDVKVVEFHPPHANKLGAENSADMVLTFRNLHNWYRDDIIEEVLKSAYAVLKPGGVLGVVQHRGDANKTNQLLHKQGYMNQAEVIQLVESLGFELSASSEVNANAKDHKNHPKGVWTLPPVLRLKEQDKAKYLAIGESDRMTLKFIKPKH